MSRFMAFKCWLISAIISLTIRQYKKARTRLTKNLSWNSWALNLHNASEANCSYDLIKLQLWQRKMKLPSLKLVPIVSSFETENWISLYTQATEQTAHLIGFFFAQWNSINGEFSVQWRRWWLHKYFKIDAADKQKEKENKWNDSVPSLRINAIKELLGRRRRS